MGKREALAEKKRIVVKVGSTTLTHADTGSIDLMKIERLVRVLTDQHKQGRDVILVSSGAIAAGRDALGMAARPRNTQEKQACAAVGQAQLMMIYQKLFAEYNQRTAQILMTKYTMIDDMSRVNAGNTFEELLRMGVIPVVNENDTVSTDEIEFGDNDTLSAIVAALVGADLLVLLSDIDGLFTDDPNRNPEARLVETVETLTEDITGMAKGATSSLGTGGMAAKISAARIATDAGADMVIVNGKNVYVLADVMDGKQVGTLFYAHKNQDFELLDYIREGRKA